MKNEVSLKCIVCFFLGYFVADIVSKFGIGRGPIGYEHLSNSPQRRRPGNPGGNDEPGTGTPEDGVPCWATNSCYPR